ncbi:MAG: cytosolic protein [Bacteriovoracaceae bacterium]|nr:cytosolic protein [Bacteriovoracaceae bacterium]
MDCKKQQNLKNCSCTYPGCEKKGACCDCLAYHLKSKQLPACCFPADVEKTYDRSFETFAKAWGLK